MTEEDWVPVDGFPGYSVNRLGEVRKDSTGRILTTRRNQYGVPYIGMMSGLQRSRVLPRLVAKTFIPKPHDHWDTPINKDGDRTNCSVDNLAWRPLWYAEQYNNQFKERYEHGIDEPVREAETDEEFPNSRAAACHYGILERDLVLSILNNTPTWLTFQKFVIAD